MNNSFEQNYISKDNSREKENFSEVEKELLALGKKSNNEFEIIKKREEVGEFKELNKNALVKDINEADKSLVKNLVEEVEKNLKAPIILDSFNKDHASRRQWENKYLNNADNKKVIEYYNNNRLGINKLSASANLMDFITSFGLVSKNMAQELEELYNKFHKAVYKYRDMELKEKIEVLNKLSEISKRLLEIMTVSEKD